MEEEEEVASHNTDNSTVHNMRGGSEVEVG